MNFENTNFYTWKKAQNENSSLFPAKWRNSDFENSGLAINEKN